MKVPNGWMLKKLSSITKETISYGIVQTGPHIEGGISYIKSSDVGSYINTKLLQRTSPDIHYKYRRSAVHPGDIVFSLRGNIGATSIVPPSLVEANLTQGTARISVDSKNDATFIYYQVDSDFIINRINSVSKGSTFKEISLAELRKISILIPPLPEQQKIAKVLSCADKEIETLQQKLAFLQQEKQALMQQLLTGKRRVNVNNSTQSQPDTAETI